MPVGTMRRFLFYPCHCRPKVLCEAGSSMGFCTSDTRAVLLLSLGAGAIRARTARSDIPRVALLPYWQYIRPTVYSQVYSYQATGRRIPLVYSF
jgi:hypothetical protein